LLQPLFDLLSQGGATLPESGFELTDENGEIIATAELGWPGEKVAVLIENDPALAGIFKEYGFEVYQLRDIQDSPETIAERFSPVTTKGGSSHGSAG
jgi:molybdopterin biosynthesis enzyme